LRAASRRAGFLGYTHRRLRRWIAEVVAVPEVVSPDGNGALHQRKKAMVLKYSIDGHPFGLPPYSNAELAVKHFINDPPLRYFSHRRSAQPPQDQKPPAPPPADIPPSVSSSELINPARPIAISMLLRLMAIRPFQRRK
jgi:hypothetical protein